MKPQRIGADALATKGWWGAHRWLVLRRASQLGVLALFLVGPWFGWWIVKGNLASSLTLGVLPLTDPYVLLQSLLARHVPDGKALIGAALVLALYLLVGGRAYCAWVCPMNLVTDAAAWLRTRLGIRGGARIARGLRLWILAGTLVTAALTGSLAWELVNPVSMLQRGLVFGLGAGWAVILVIFLFDLLIAQHGWCGHLCPVGSFYGLIGRLSWLRMSAPQRAACNDCADCYAVCPEPLILKPVLKAVDGAGPVLDTAACTQCGRCADVCSKDVFEFRLRGFAADDRPPRTIPTTRKETTP